jgi:hypothetical protein
MAWLKMVGLDVTPVTPSSSTMRRNSPLVIRPRRMLSYQTLWPSLGSSSRGLLMSLSLSDGIRSW